MVKNKEIKRSFILQPLFYKWVGLFQSLLDCFSTEGQAFSKLLPHLQFSLYAGFRFLQFFNALYWSLITLFYDFQI